MGASDKDLRQNLLRKLRGGDRRFAHLNATTARSRQKIDYTRLDLIKDGLANDFLENLVSAPPNLSFRIPLKDINKQILEFTNRKKDVPEEERAELMKKLQNLSTTKKGLEFLEAHQKEEFSEFGTKSFAFGYPLLMKQVGGEKDDVICAPLFLWYLDIERDYHADALILSRNEESPILFNEMLDYYLESELKLDFSDTVEQINARISDDGLLNKTEIVDSVQDIVTKLSSGFGKVDLTTPQLTPKDRKGVSKLLEEHGATEMVLNAGIFGIFRAGKQSIINDLKALIEQEGAGPIENPDIDIEQDYPYSVINTDPTQELVIERISNHQNLIIQGPPGTGKSQTLTALITNALANNQRTLVVCEKRTAMEIIKRNLEDIGLGDYVALIENVNRDRSTVIDRARAINESKHIAHYGVSSEFQAAKQLNQSSALQVSRHHDAIHAVTKQYGGQEGYGQYDNKYFLGKYQKLSRHVNDEAWRKCESDFAKIPFIFTNVEFDSLVAELEEAKGAVVTLQTDLNRISLIDIAPSTYQQDRLAIESYFKSKQAEFIKVGEDIEKLLAKAVAVKQNKLRARLLEAKKFAGEALSLIEIEANDFKWRAIQPHLDKSAYQQEVSTKAAARLLGAVHNHQDEVDRYGEILKEIRQDLSVKIKEYRDYLKSVASDLGALHELGIESTSTRISDRALSTFSKKHKEIKDYKAGIHSAVLAANRLANDVAYVLQLPTLDPTTVTKSVLQTAIKETPSDQELIKLINGADAHTILGEHLPDEIHKGKAVHEYVRFLLQNRWQAYENLRHAMATFYLSKVRGLLSEYFQDDLQPKTQDAALSISIAALHKIQAYSINEASLSSYSIEAINNSSPSDIPGMEDALLKASTALQENDQPYGRALGQLRDSVVAVNNANDAVIATQKIITDIVAMLEEIDSDFYAYYRWCGSFLSLSPITQRVITLFTRNNIADGDWQSLAQAMYFHKLLIAADTPSLLNADTALERFMSSSTNIKALLVDTIKAKWAGNRLTSIGSLESGTLRFNSLYNKRGAKGQRRNSLRRIIERDFKLFSSLFPVIICNPSSSAALFPLKKDLFDLVLFDEASQLRLEDTYTSLYRGKAKIISGDRHQMPPSNYFQSELEDDTEEYGDDDESLQISEITGAESLLDYADINGYRSEMLKIHYRSDHADLIQFSNHAFYDAKLAPIPKFESYVPIEYKRVNGVYKERQNEAEADYVVQWLKDYCAQHDVLQSIGVATLNLPQSELIKEKIAAERTDDEIFNTSMTKLDELGLFVKNLENIQGDERDIIMLSTTFGNDSEGKFRQNFGPLSNGNGYRLLNVLVTRAKHKLIVATSIPDSHINRYKDELAVYGKDRRAIFYTYLAYAKAVAESDESIKQHILDLLNNADKETIVDIGGQTESPFEEEVLESLEQAVDRRRIILQYQVGGENFRIDMMILNKDCTAPMLAIECDGYAYHSSPQAYLYDAYRREILKAKGGFDFYSIWSTNWFHDQRNEEAKLIATIREYDAKEK